MGKKLIAILFILFGVYSASGQYYDWGQNPASVRWMQTGDEHVKYIYPEYYERQAARLMKYMDTVRTQIGYGFRHGPMKRMPLIMQTQNFSANGIVMLAPRRMEPIVISEGVAPATPWLKQLAPHVYRHAVQYTYLNRGLIQGLSPCLGQQGPLAGMSFLPTSLA